jgi:hypothetical protein
MVYFKEDCHGILVHVPTLFALIFNTAYFIIKAQYSKFTTLSGGKRERERERERERVIGRNRRKIEFSGKLQTLDLKWSLALSMDRRHIQRKGLLSI